MVLPAEFVPVAEADPVTIWELTMHTLRLAIASAAGIARATRSGSRSTCRRRDRPPGLVDEIAKILSEAGLAPERLTLEVTESAVMDDPVKVAAALEEVRSGDAAIAIDDFGTGYSSLARLEELPVDSLKIDRLFLKRADEDRGQTMLSSIIELAHGLGLTACAEGVEDRHLGGADRSRLRHGPGIRDRPSDAGGRGARLVGRGPASGRTRQRQHPVIDP